MCGIIGFLGKQNSIPFLIQGLKLLQNRGYDSVGISCISNGELNTIKFASKTTCDALDILEKKVKENSDANKIEVIDGIVKVSPPPQGSPKPATFTQNPKLKKKSS